jgi:alkylhydroperoxidase/carboxymuconolactone decarboxylase family protein YurZ
VDSNVLQVDQQIKDHLKGAVNNGATVEEVRAVRDIIVRICEVSGMRSIGEDEHCGRG